ncbi:hypothetical protein [Nocardia abscessus]|uniref:hypothetical protein n=1 Tax=Nocardia abscessus TaxID=120957 RepID=UPI0024573379|nr:hypothetical protein [Nocardia abscessus]
MIVQLSGGQRLLVPYSSAFVHYPEGVNNGSAPPPPPPGGRPAPPLRRAPRPPPAGGGPASCVGSAVSMLSLRATAPVRDRY